jgi:hypothetical protein
MSPYRMALDLTAHTIHRRIRYFRNLIVAVVIVGIVAIVWALLARSAAGLVEAAVLVPLCGLFFVADYRALDAWRTELLASWVAWDIDFAALSAAIRANPSLPRHTTEGMLATLPTVGDLAEEQQMATSTREAIAAEVISRYRSASDAMVLKTAASALVACALIGAVVMRGWTPLWVLLGLTFLPIAGSWLSRKHTTVPVGLTAPPPPPAR